MKTRCPYCNARQKFLDEMIGLGVNCSQCGQTFELGSERLESNTPSISQYETGDADSRDNIDGHQPDFVNQTSLDFVKNLSLLSKGFWLLSRGWTVLAISLAVLLPLSTAGALEAVPPQLVPIFAKASRLAMLFVGMSCVAYVAGQACCVFAHPAGSECRKSIGKSLLMSLAGAALRITGTTLKQPIMKSFGSILSASAFNHLLTYLGLVAMHLGAWSVTLDVAKLSQLYRRFFTFLILGFILLVAAPVPVRLMVYLVFAVIVGLIAFFIVFSIKFGAILLRLHRLIVEKRQA